MEKLPDILILGLGKTGVACARYCLARLGTEYGSVTVLDGSGHPEVGPIADALASEGARVEMGVSEVEGDFDLCIASPGIPPSSSLLRSAVAACPNVISEIEFAFERSTAAWVAVTGTNGKTTTTALVTHLLNTGGVPAEAVGNIGAASIDAVAENSGEVMVAEVSSFQLALTKNFHPRVAVLLNVTPDHIDWHGSYERYAADKAKVFDNLGPDDFAVIDADDPGAAAYIPVVGAKGARIVRVSLNGGDCEARLQDGMLTLVSGDHTYALVSQDELLIRGPHNVSNALAAAAAAHAMGVGPEALRDGLRTFAPIEHRLEPAGTAAGAEWFNDSKATNPDAVSKALAAFGDRPVVLLLGGRNKGSDFKPLALEAAERSRAVILFGEAAPELAAAFAHVDHEVHRVATMADAVQMAARIADPGDAVVLSPACASYDEFKNYEERGRSFKAMVASMGEGE